MDGALTYFPIHARPHNKIINMLWASRRACCLLKFGSCEIAKSNGTDNSADLGCSSKYSSGNLEGRSGEGFQVNCI